MANVIEKSEWDTMKSWVQSIYSKTKGSTPSISDPAQGSVILASQAQQLQNLLTVAYESYTTVGCSSHYGSNYTTDNGSQKSAPYVTVRDVDRTYNSTYKQGDTSCTANYGSNDGDK